MAVTLFTRDQYQRFDNELGFIPAAIVSPEDHPAGVWTSAKDKLPEPGLVVLVRDNWHANTLFVARFNAESLDWRSANGVNYHPLRLALEWMFIPDTRQSGL